MEEKRRHKRLDLDVSVQLERLDEDGVTTLKYVHVDVTDISRSGIGFSSKQKLEVHTMILRFRFGQKRLWMQSLRLYAEQMRREDITTEPALSA